MAVGDWTFPVFLQLRNRVATNAHLVSKVTERRDHVKRSRQGKDLSTQSKENSSV